MIANTFLSSSNPLDMLSGLADVPHLILTDILYGTHHSDSERDTSDPAKGTQDVDTVPQEAQESADAEKEDVTPKEPQEAQKSTDAGKVDVTPTEPTEEEIRAAEDRKKRDEEMAKR